MTADSTELPGDSSPPTALQTTSSSNFRQLDDAFLQNQARIWLGEILQIRFDEQLDISDLLADGELLFEVADVISKMLPTLSADDSQLKVYEWKTLVSSKSTRRYMPYHNVDSFVRMCKKMGMDGIDLFTPSDVVEKRNTRKVCMCLRSLSKKSRIRDLNVPDFDSVTCTLTMPTDMVGCIRKSLEMSQSSSSPSVEQEAGRVRFCRRMSNSTSVVSNGVSDNCDEAESRLVDAESYGSSDFGHFADDAESPNISGSQFIRGIDSALQLSMVSDFKDEDNDRCEYLSPTKAESVGSPCSQYFTDEELSIASSNWLGSRVSGKIPELNSETKNGYLNSDVSNIPIDWGSDHFDVGTDNDADVNDNEVNCESQDLDTACSLDFYPIGNNMCNMSLRTSINASQVGCHSTQKSLEFATNVYLASKDPELIHEDAPSNNNAVKHEPFVCEVWRNNDASIAHGKSNGNDLPGEQIIESSCISKPLESPDCLYKIENQASNAYTKVINVGGDSCYSRLINGAATSDVGDLGNQLSYYEEQPPCSVKYDAYDCNRSSSLDLKSNSYDEFMGDKEVKLFKMPHNDHSQPEIVIVENRKEYSKDCHDAVEGFEGHNAQVKRVDDKPIDIDIDIAIPVSSFATAICDSQLEAQCSAVFEDREHKQLQCVKEAEKGESEFASEDSIKNETPLNKPQRKLLKSFVKGTALLGVAVFLLHLIKNRQESRSGAKKRPAQIVIQGAPKSTQKSGNSSSVYPAEKLNFGI